MTPSWRESASEASLGKPLVGPAREGGEIVLRARSLVRTDAGKTLAHQVGGDDRELRAPRQLGGEARLAAGGGAADQNGQWRTRTPAEPLAERPQLSGTGRSIAPGFARSARGRDQPDLGAHQGPVGREEGAQLLAAWRQPGVAIGVDERLCRPALTTGL